MRYSMAFLPLVGGIIGLGTYLISGVNPFAELPVAVRILLTLALPLLITGGFHVDGFMDTEDAMHSFAPTEKKLEILKDPHIGAFAVIALVKWLMIYAAAITAILLNERTDERILVILGLTFVISRSLLGLTSFFFPKAKKEGMLYEETKTKPRVVVILLSIQLAAAVGVSLWMDLLSGSMVVLLYTLHTIYYRYTVYKNFGGVTGDTAGYFLTTGEILAALVLAGTLYLK